MPGRVKRLRLAAGDLGERRVVEDDVCRHLVRACALEPPLLERGEDRIVRLRLAPRRPSPRLQPELAQEARRRARPRDEQVPLRARQADVEQPPLLGDRVRRLRLPHRQLLLLHTRDEHRLELEPLRAVQRQEVDAAARLAAVAEAPLELRDEAGAVEVGELLGQPDEPCRGRSGAPSRARRACRADSRPSRAPRRARARPPATRAARSTKRALSRPRNDAPCAGMPASCSASSKSTSRAFVRQRIATSSYGTSSARIRSTTKAASSSHGRSSGSGPVRTRRAQRLLGAAELRHEPVRELEHLRRRAVVLLEPDHRRVREPLRHREQVLGRRAGERVDRLVVVADDAELVARRRATGRAASAAAG